MKDEIIVVGSLNMDLVTRVKQRPAVGETVLGKQFFTSFGGKGANQAFAAAKLGGNVRMVGKVGNDHYGRDMISWLQRSNIRTDFIAVDAEEASGIAVIVIDARADNSIIVVPGANGKLLPADIAKLTEPIRNAKLLVLQLEIPLETAMQAIEIASACRVPVLLDPSPVPDGEFPASLFGKISYIAPNSTELRHLSGVEITDDESVIRASQILLEKGVQCVLAKLGERGALMSTREETHHIPGFQVKAVDTTAAGDTFIGAFAAGIVQGWPLRECARFANAAAALTVTRYGAQDSMPSLKETTDFLKKAGADS